MSIDRWAERAQRLALQGDFAGAALIFERAAADLLRGRRHEDAVSALLSAARVQMMLGNFQRASALLADAELPARSLGASSRPSPVADLRRVQAELADLAGDAHARRQAWQAVREAATGELRALALQRLAELARDAGRPGDMVPLLEEVLETTQDSEHQADARLLLSMAHHALGQLDAAQAALDGVPAGPRLEGQRGQLALARGQLDEALRHAEAARAAAVDQADPQSYLGASLLLVMIHQHAGREVDAYDTLLRARASLTDLLGAEAAGLVQPALDAFTARHGDAMDALHAEWAARRRAQRS